MLASLARHARTACTETVALSSRAFSSESSGPGYVIFGASGGIGSALAARLVKQGGSVLLCGRSEDKLKALADKIGGGTPFVADALDGDAAEEAVKKMEGDHGEVSGVANCIGSLVLKSLHTTSADEFRQHWEINAMSAFNATKAAVNSMKRCNGGSIVLFSSSVAEHGTPNHEAIASAKAAVHGLMLGTAATYAPKNIRVNCIGPGMTDTPLAEKITSSQSALKASKGMHPLKRIGTADQVAAVAELLLDPANDNITGTMICVDGGLANIQAQGTST